MTRPTHSTIIAPDNPGPEVLAQMMQVEVTKVFDGDGFLARVWHPLKNKWVDRIPFRFAFIDAPEIGQQFGEEAREFLNGLIAQKALKLDLVAKESMQGVPLDPYKRVLCMGFLTEQIEQGVIRYFLKGQTDEGLIRKTRSVVRNIELEMVVNGWAWVVERYSFEREDEYFVAQEDARQNRRGLWSSDNPEAPWKFKQKQKRKSKTQTSQSANHQYKMWQ
jgi:micrococcal nuclease